MDTSGCFTSLTMRETSEPFSLEWLPYAIVPLALSSLPYSVPDQCWYVPFLFKPTSLSKVLHCSHHIGNKLFEIWKLESCFQHIRFTFCWWFFLCSVIIFTTYKVFRFCKIKFVICTNIIPLGFHLLFNTEEYM